MYIFGSYWIKTKRKLKKQKKEKKKISKEKDWKEEDCTAALMDWLTVMLWLEGIPGAWAEGSTIG